MTSARIIDDTVFDDGDFIPGLPNEITEASANGTLAIFVGAGISCQMGCCDWEKYAHARIEHAKRQGLLIQEEVESLKQLPPRMAITICKGLYREHNRPSDKSAREFLGGDIEKSKILENLYAWRGIYVTTNYDDLLDRIALSKTPEICGSAITQEASDPLRQSPVADSTVVTQVSKKPGPIVLHKFEYKAIANLRYGNVIHLHGSVKEESSMIETIDEYVKFYLRDDVKEFLDELFCNHTVLFIGYGLSEYELLEYIIRPRHERTKRARAFALLACRDRQGNIQKLQNLYFRSMDVEPIPYPIWKHGHTHLATVVERWSKQLSIQASDKDFYERVRLIEEVTDET